MEPAKTEDKVIKKEGPETGPQKFSIKAMILNISRNVMHGQLVELLNNTKTFATKVKQSDSLKLDKKEFLNIVDSLHKISAMAFGPTAEQFRWLHSFPVFSECSVDRNIIHYNKFSSIRDENEFQSLNLDALEYLLFSESNKSGCNLFRYPEIRAWVSQPEATRVAGRKALSIEILNRLEERLEKLIQSWASGGEDAIGVLLNAETESSVLNKITDAMLRLEEVKNTSLGIPLGFHQDCFEDEFCSDEIAHSYSRLSLEAMKGHIAGFRLAFEGGKNEGDFGFDDLLESLDQQSITKEIREKIKAIDNSITTLTAKDNLAGHIKQADYEKCQNSTSTQRTVEVCALYFDFKGLINIFKSKLLIALSLRAPPTYQGDGDGGKI